MKKWMHELAQREMKPFYIYDLDGIETRLNFMQDNLGDKFHIHFAMKANNSPHILSAIQKLGHGVDVVSGGELKAALACGFAADKIIFSGVGKTIQEIELALNNKIRQLHIESEPELIRIRSIAKKLGVKPNIAFRVNPDVNPETHPYITTGFRENKFGLEFQVVEKLLKDKTLADDVEVTGLTLHIGSQILDTKVFQEAVEKTLKIYRDYPGRFSMLDVGGGLGIDYHKADLKEDENRFIEYAQKLKISLKDIPQVLLEPGRFVVARFGWLISPVQYIKHTSFKNFIITSAGMQQLLRPALYEAYHRIELLRTSGTEDKTYDVVGPICESSDVLGRDRRLPGDVSDSDWLIISDVGAYGYTMASHYNLHEFPKEFVISKGKIL